MIDKQKVWVWLCSKPERLTNGGIFALVAFAMLLGMIIGHDDGYSRGFFAGKNAVCPTSSSAAVDMDSPPMNFSAFLDWAGKIELPPMGWVLLILLALVMLK